MLARRGVTAADVPALGAATQVKPPATGGQALGTPVATRRNFGVYSLVVHGPDTIRAGFNITPSVETLGNAQARQWLGVRRFRQEALHVGPTRSATTPRELLSDSPPASSQGVAFRASSKTKAAAPPWSSGSRVKAQVLIDTLPASESRRCPETLPGSRSLDARVNPLRAFARNPPRLDLPLAVLAANLHANFVSALFVQHPQWPTATRPLPAIAPLHQGRAMTHLPFRLGGNPVEECDGAGGSGCGCARGSAGRDRRDGQRPGAGPRLRPVRAGRSAR